MSYRPLAKAAAPLRELAVRCCEVRIVRPEPFVRCTRCAKAKAEAPKAPRVHLPRVLRSSTRLATRSRRRGAAATQVLPEQQRTSLKTTTMIAFEDTVVDRESELDWETLVT